MSLERNETNSLKQRQNGKENDTLDNSLHHGSRL